MSMNLVVHAIVWFGALRFGDDRRTNRCGWMILRSVFLIGLFLSQAKALNAVEPRTIAMEPRLTLAPFRADVTPPIGDGPCVGCMPTVTSIEHPLELRGIVLRAGTDVYVIAAVDYCGICNTSDEYIRDEMARAAGTTRDRVVLQSLHQHTAPILDADAVRILHGEHSEQLKQHLRFTKDVATRAADAILKAVPFAQSVTRVVATKAIVERTASNRRVPRSDGSIGVRASLTHDQSLRDAPEGLIDPWLRTLTFFAGDIRLAQLHYYATHPQTFYGDARISWDCVGMARQKFEQETGVFQIYFNGCGGNVTVGKYNDGSRTARDGFASRLQDAMRRSSSGDSACSVDVSGMQKSEIEWTSAPVQFTVREEGAFHPKLLEQQLHPDQPFSVRLTAAMFSGFGERLRSGHIAQMTRLRIGAIDIVHLPGEPFVEFQLFAQTQAEQGTFVCVAGYGDCGVWYYGPDQIYSDRGGFEQTWSLTGPCEQSVRSAMSLLLER
ncbi:MAG: hypothetical protein JNL58_13290 [Planctomyces sp.]|nr:hypothetical protein [Planctomyces sp.]